LTKQRPAQNEPKSLDPFEDEAEIVSGGCQDGVGGVAVAVSEVVPVHSVLVLDMADDWLDGGASFHLAFDLRGDSALLASGEDMEPVGGRGVVALVAGVGQDALDAGAGQGFDGKRPILLLCRR
jgi:hypothetical protein